MRISMNKNLELDVQFKILDERIREHGISYATEDSAGMDLRACIDTPLTLKPGESILVSTGISVFVGNPNYASVILPRSGMGHKNGIILGNSVGLIDADYQGPLMMSLLNRKSEDFVINPMDRVAQLVFLPIARAKLTEVQEFKATARGAGGFNSTGVK